MPHYPQQSSLGSPWVQIPTTVAVADEVTASPATGLDAGLVPELSTETSSTFREADGSYRLEAYTEPVNYQDELGFWNEIDNSLVDAPGSTYAVENAANDYTAQIPADASTTPIKFSANDAWATMRMHGLDQAPQVEGSAATFADATGAAEVTYSATAEGLKEDIVLGSRPSSGPTYTYTVDTSPGITPTLTEIGAIDFVDAGGDVAFTMPVGNMTDSAATAAYTESVEYDLTASASSWILTVTPDADWLMDASRVYPVTIDPSLTAEPVVRDCWIKQESDLDACGSNAISGYLRVGVADNGYKRRSLLDFDVTSIPAAATVSNADINLYLDALSTSGSAPADYAFHTAGKLFDSDATWNTSGANGAWTGGSPGATAYGTKHFQAGTEGYKTFPGLGSLVQGWVDGSVPHRGLVLKQVEETANKVLWFYSSSTAGSNNGKRPYLDVDYTIPTGHLVSGTVVDGSGDPVGGAQVVANIENDVTTPEEKTELLEVASGTTNANGGFTLTGGLSVPATYDEDDGSVRVELTIMDTDVARFYTINAVPPAEAGGNWTWSTMADTAVIDHPVEVEALVGQPVTDLAFKLDVDKGVANGSASSGVYTAIPGEVGSGDAVDDGSEYAPAMEFDPDDPAGSDATDPSGTPSAEMGVATDLQYVCNPSEAYWAPMNIYKTRLDPVVWSAIADDAKDKFFWNTSTRTQFQSAIAGAGKNFAGGLMKTVDKVNGAGFVKTFDGPYIKQFFGMQWKYRKQRLMCYNAGNPIDTKRRRWIAHHWTLGSAPIASSWDFTCQSSHKSVVSSDSVYVSKSKTVRFNQFIEIAGVRIDTTQGYNTFSEKHQYIAKNGSSSFTLCGRGADPGVAPIVKEVVS